MNEAMIREMLANSITMKQKHKTRPLTQTN